MNASMKVEQLSECNIMEMRNKVHRLFGERAERVTTDEMNTIFHAEIYGEMIQRNGVVKLSLTMPLPSKQDHGDIDIVYVTAGTSIADAACDALGEKLLDASNNGDVFSILFKSNIGKTVHVDFIHATEETFDTKLQYFAYNDFSGVVGMVSKKLGFKYGSEGFFKRYRDKRGNYHDILVTHNLIDGLAILGFDVSRFYSIQNPEDIAKFVLSSPLFGVDMVEHESLNQSDKKSYKRPVIEYVVNLLRLSRQHATATDPDVFFKRNYPAQYSRCMETMEKIEAAVAVKSAKYDGHWIMTTFGLPPGPMIGTIMKHLSDVFGNTLDSQRELVVMNEVGKFVSLR